MPTFVKHRVAVGAAGLAVLAGAGGAYAATRGSAATPTAGGVRTAAKAAQDPAAEANAFLDDVAKRLNVSRDQLDTALKGAASARVDAAVADGRLTKEQGDALKQRIEQGNFPLAGVPFLGPRGAGKFGIGIGIGKGIRLGFGPGKSLNAAATYLGLTKAELRTQLRSGKSLAQVAKDKNKPVDGLKQAMRAAVVAELDQAVKDNKLTDAQRTDFLKRFDARLDELVNETPPERPFFRGRRHP